MAWVRISEGVPVKAWDFLQLLVQEEVDIPTPSSAGRLLGGGGIFSHRTTAPLSQTPNPLISCVFYQVGFGIVSSSDNTTLPGSFLKHSHELQKTQNKTKKPHHL